MRPYKWQDCRKLLAFVLLLAAPSLAAATTPAWEAIAASGEVSGREDLEAEWLPVHRGDELVAGALVRTGPRGRATFVRDGDIVVLDPDATLELPVAPASGESVRQTSGCVQYKIDGHHTRDFKVVTPFLVAGVKGTVFTVRVERSRAWVSVDEGAVDVTARNSGERIEVLAGEAVALDATRRGTLERVRAADLADQGARARKEALARARSHVEAHPAPLARGASGEGRETTGASGARWSGDPAGSAAAATPGHEAKNERSDEAGPADESDTLVEVDENRHGGGMEDDVDDPIDADDSPGPGRDEVRDEDTGSGRPGSDDDGDDDNGGPGGGDDDDDDDSGPGGGDDDDDDDSGPGGGDDDDDDDSDPGGGDDDDDDDSGPGSGDDDDDHGGGGDETDSSGDGLSRLGRHDGQDP